MSEIEMLCGVRVHWMAAGSRLLEGEEMGRLVESVREHGLIDPLTRRWIDVDGDRVPELLDGRNRLCACNAARVEPAWTDFDGTNEEAEEFVEARATRREDTKSQRALKAYRWRERYQRIARENQRRAGREYGRAIASTDLSVEAIRWIDLAAAAVGVSGDLVQWAANLHQAAERSETVGLVVDLVCDGRVPITTAHEVTRLDEEAIGDFVDHVASNNVPAHKAFREAKRGHEHRARTRRLGAISQGNAPLDAGPERFPVIYADPPWRYEHVKTESRAIENQYPTMDLDDICAMPVSDIATDDAVLFLWTTSPKLQDGLRVVREWGFSYRTCMVWDKERIGMGYWARQQHELLLIATRGAPPAPAPSSRPSSVVREKRDPKHSQKPESFRRLIESMFPELPRIELFARTAPDGWATWGNQAGEAA